MTEQQRTFMNINRMVGPVFVFGVLFFVLYRFTPLGLEVSGLIAAFVAITDYFVLTWLMQRLGDRE